MDCVRGLDLWLFNLNCLTLQGMQELCPDEGEIVLDSLALK